MIDFLQDEAWNRLRRQMHAPLVAANAVPATVVGGLSLHQLNTLATHGMNILASQLKIAPDHTLFFKDARVYIELAADDADLPMLHLTCCPSVQATLAQGIHVSTNTERQAPVSVVNADGDWDVAHKPKPVCLDCLDTLNWQGLHEVPDDFKTHIAQQFNLHDFYQSYPVTLPLHTYQQLWLDEGERINTYVEDWPQIADYVKAYSRLICPSCQRSFSHHPAALTVYHVNGKKYDNTLGNLRVTCQDCQPA